jgi:sulfate permease, SulP family
MHWIIERIQLPPRWAFLTPFMSWLPNVGRDEMRADVLAAITGAIVVIPQGVAFATIAGMPPEYGLYAGMVPAIIAALYGSSKHLVSGPTTAASVVLFSTLSSMATPGSPHYVALALTLTFLVGLFELGLGLARMGALVNFISHSVLVGFTAGAALLIAAAQAKYFFGLTVDSGSHFHDLVLGVGRHVLDINPYATIVAVSTLLIGIIVKRILPRFPYMIVAMVGGSLVAILLQHRLGIARTHIDNVGALPAALPPLSAPSFSIDTISQLASAALAVTLFALTEAVTIGRALAARGGYRIDGNQEFIAQGLSNIVGSFFSGYVATGSFNRSGMNFAAGARTPLAAVVAGFLLMILVLLVAPFGDYLPKAAMAGILFLVAWGLVDFEEIRRILHSSGREASVFAVTFLSAVLVDLEFAIFAGVLLSLLLYLERTSRPRIVTRTPDPHLPDRAFSGDPELPQCPQLRFVRIDGSLFFGAVNHVHQVLERLHNDHPTQKHLALVATGMNFIDFSGAKALEEEAHRRRSEDGDLYLIKVKDGVWDMLDNSGCMDDKQTRNVFANKEAAIRGIYQKLDKSICARCDRRIFLECGS